MSVSSSGKVPAQNTMTRCSNRLLILLAVALPVLAAACRPPGAPASAPASRLATGSWEAVLAEARGTTVVWRMWRGDPAINAYVDGWVAPRIREQFGISVQAIESQGPQLVNELATEREALGDRPGTSSLLWINGETFAQLRAERLLDGPWAASLPNARLVVKDSPIVSRDFEQDPAGYESPWGTVQFALIYDAARTPDPPESIEALAAWIKQHPGRFTHDQQFTGMTLLKGIMYGLAGGVEKFQGGFDEERYRLGRERLFAWLASIRPFLWRKGETYPPDVAAMHRLFANGEIDFTMSNNQNEVVNKVRQNVFPPASRALLLDEGTIANAHFVGIPFNAPNAAGALVLANFLLSPEAQLEKQRPEIWGDGTVLDVAGLPAPWPDRFEAVARDGAALPRELLASRARPEVHPLYHSRLLEDWRQTLRRGTP
jgi:putative spermidine/putrescine transport system substrate-binding protein